jgi:protein phosphatase
VKLDTGAFTHEGQLRENNEDSYLVDAQRGLFAIADGMGGHRGGEVASSTAIEALRARVASGDALEIAVAKANDAVIQRAEGDENLTGMGTTMTAVTPAAGGRQLFVAHVGDSRAYLVHDGSLERITDDHSLVEELVREGRLTPEQAEAHPQRAIVTRALGVQPGVDVDTYTVDVVAGDRVVLCSDGLNTMVRDRDIERLARSAEPAQRTAEILVEAANTAGGEDNITVVVIDVLEVDDLIAAPDVTSAEPADAAAVAEAPVEMSAPVPPSSPTTASEARPKGTKLRTLRGAILVLLPVVLILGAATAAVGWYARRSYFVGTDQNEVVIYKGVPGGVLGWDPTVDERTGIQVSALPPIDRGRVEANDSRGSLDTAHAYVGQLQANIDATSTTTTTRPPRTTTTRPATATTRPRATPTT